MNLKDKSIQVLWNTIKNLRQENEKLKDKECLRNARLDDAYVTIPKLKYKNITDLQIKLVKENRKLKALNKKLKELCDKYEEEHNTTFKEWQQDIQANRKAKEYIENYDVFKEFTFPLMKKWEENQVKSSIDYQFKNDLKKNLINILEEKNEYNK